MRTTFLAAVSALALLAGPALAAGMSQSGASGTTGGTTTQSQGGGMPGSESQSPGAAPQTGTLDEEEVRTALEAHGFTDVGELKRVGNLYEVEATKDGKLVTLVIDPATGQATIAE